MRLSKAGSRALQRLWAIADEEGAPCLEDPDFVSEEREVMEKAALKCGDCPMVVKNRCGKARKLTQANWGVWAGEVLWYAEPEDEIKEDESE